MIKLVNTLKTTEDNMKKCFIKFVGNKWVAEDEDGKRWAAFDADHRAWAVEVAVANGFTIA